MLFLEEAKKAIMLERKFILLVFTLFSVWSSSICQTKEAVIERYLKAIGGKENWIGIRTQIDSGLIIKYVQKNFFHEATVDTNYFKTFLVRPNKQKFVNYEKHINDSGKVTWTQSITCYNGQYLWTGRPGAIHRQSEEESKFYEKTIDSGLPYILFSDEPMEIEYLGKMKLENDYYEVLKTKGPNQFFYTLVYFDTITGHIACTVGHDTPVKRFTYNKDYKRIGNIVISMLSESFIDGLLVEKTLIEEFKVNHPINVSIFSEN